MLTVYPVELAAYQVVLAAYQVVLVPMLEVDLVEFEKTVYRPVHYPLPAQLGKLLSQMSLKMNLSVKLWPDDLTQISAALVLIGCRLWLL